MYFECVDSSRGSRYSRGRRSGRSSGYGQSLPQDDDEPPEIKSCRSSVQFVASTRSSCHLNNDNQKLIDDLLPLEDGFKFLSFKYVITTFTRLIIPSLFLGVSNYGYDLLNMLGFYYASKSGDASVSASFGLMIFFNTVLIFGFYYSIDEKVAVSTAQAVGAHNYEQARKILNQGYFTVLVLIVFYFAPVVCWSESIFLTIGLEPKNAALTSLFLKKLFPIDIARMFNELLFTFSLSQGITFNYGGYAILNMLVSALSGWIADSMFGLGIDSWLVARLVHEIILFATYIYPFIYHVDPRSKGILGLSSIFSEYSLFVKDSFKYTVSLYSEWLGMEIGILFTGLTNDMAQISAYTSLSNISYFIMNTGLGFSAVGRTRINLLLGRGHKEAAKNFFIIFMAGLLACSFVISGLSLALKKGIASLYGGESVEVVSLLQTLLTIYSVCLPLDFIFSFLFTVCRSTGQVSLIVMLNVGLLICYCTGMDYYLIKISNGTCISVLINLYLTLFFIFSIAIRRLTVLNWKEMEVVPEDSMMEELQIIEPQHQKGKTKEGSEALL